MFSHRIFFSRLIVESSIGILEHERQTTQPLYIDAEIEVELPHHVDDQDIQSVLDYRQLRQTLITTCSRMHVNLLETLIQKLAQQLLTDFEAIATVRLRLSKPLAFDDCDTVGIEIFMRR